MGRWPCMAVSVLGRASNSVIGAAAPRWLLAQGTFALAEQLSTNKSIDGFHQSERADGCVR